MPDPPRVDLFTRYVIENPWPAAVILMLVGAVIAWTGVREEIPGRQRTGLVIIIVGIVISSIGLLFKSAGEHAEDAVREFVQLVVDNDLVGAEGMVASDATFALGANAPGLPRDSIVSLLDDRGDRTIESNRITRCDGYGTAHETAEVHLACATDLPGGYGVDALTKWVIDLERRDGDWVITRIAWVSLNNRPPPIAYGR